MAVRNIQGDQAGKGNLSTHCHHCCHSPGLKPAALQAGWSRTGVFFTPGTAAAVGRGRKNGRGMVGKRCASKHGVEGRGAHLTPSGKLKCA